jgi:hypothetical protein
MASLSAHPFWGARDLVIYELVHVWQYEQFGGFALFLRQYLWGCVTLGYTKAPMERKAQAIAAKVCASSLHAPKKYLVIDSCWSIVK